MIGPDEYDQLVARDFKDYSEPHRQMYEAIVALLKNKPASILEIGCGIGWGYKQLLNNNCISYYEGIDPSDKCKNFFRKNYALTINQKTFEQTQLRRAFDFSICIEVIEHIKGLDLINWFKKMVSRTEIASFISTPDKNIDPHGLYTKEEVQDSMYKAGYKHVVKIEWQLPHTLFIGEV